MWLVKLPWFSLLCTVSLKVKGWQCMPFFKTDLMIHAVLSTANLPLLLICCFYLWYILCISQQGQADHSDGKVKAIQETSCSFHVRAIIWISWVTWIPLGWNKPTKTIKADTLLLDPHLPWRSLQRGSRPQWSHWYLFPENCAYLPFPFPLWSL